MILPWRSIASGLCQHFQPETANQPSFPWIYLVYDAAYQLESLMCRKYVLHYCRDLPVDLAVIFFICGIYSHSWEIYAVEPSTVTVFFRIHRSSSKAIRSGPYLLAVGFNTYWEIVSLANVTHPLHRTIQFSKTSPIGWGNETLLRNVSAGSL
jgi:hypothetical protein